MRRRRLRPLVLVFILGALVFWSCSGGGGEPEPAATPEELAVIAVDKGSPSSGSAVPPSPPPEPDKIELSGRGDYATRFVELETGLAVFGMTHAGESNFIVQLLDSDGGLVALLVNEIGRYEGYVGQGVRKNNYLLNINADGQWAVVITQPRPATGTKPPLTSNGTGDFVMGPMLLDKGLTRFAFTHGGSSNFAVVLLDYNGDWVELLVNEIGGYSGSQAVRVPGGTYWLNITADGTWTADVTK